MTRPWIVVSLLGLAGCTGHLRHVGPEIAAPPVPQRTVVYLVNPELTQERAVLEASSLYTLSADSSTPTKVTLMPLERMPACGNPIMASMFTLGLVPVHIPDGYTMRFTEAGPAGRKTEVYSLDMDYRYSIWERLNIFSNETEELGAALREAALAK